MPNRFRIDNKILKCGLPQIYGVHFSLLNKIDFFLCGDKCIFLIASFFIHPPVWGFMQSEHSPRVTSILLESIKSYYFKYAGGLEITEPFWTLKIVDSSPILKFNVSIQYREELLSFSFTARTISGILDSGI